MRIKNNIAKLLNDRNMRPCDFARSVGVTYQLVWHWSKNRGQPKNTVRDPDRVRKICEVLEVTEKELFYPVYNEYEHEKDVANV